MRRALPCCAFDPETRFDFVGGKNCYRCGFAPRSRIIAQIHVKW